MAPQVASLRSGPRSKSLGHTNGDAEYELPKYLTESEASGEAGSLKEDEEDQEVETFSGDDL